MRSNRLRLILVSTVLALAAGCSSSGGSASSSGTVEVTPSTGATTSGSPSATAGTAPTTAADRPADIPAIVAEVQPSVVTVLTDDGVGSGVIYRAEGVIITNAHVVGTATDVQVAFADGRRTAGRVVASDTIVDLAVVRVDRDDLPAARFQTQLPRVGETAIAIGSPLGFEGTVTAGIISGLHREIPGSAAQGAALVDLVQTDAAISPGNSGGALVNGAGEVIGINDAYLPPSTGAVSLGFAIPAATVVDVVDQLLESGVARHAFVGVTPATVTGQVAERLGLPVDRGVVVLEVVAGGPAAAAGIQPGDVVVAVDGRPVASVEEFLGELRERDPGQTATLALVGAGGQRDVPVVLADRPRRG